MAEMRDIVLTTGGMAVQTDTYHNVVFKVGATHETMVKLSVCALFAPTGHPARR